MKINCIRINGLKEPIGYELPFLSVSFKVTDTSSQRPEKSSARRKMAQCGQIGGMIGSVPAS